MNTLEKSILETVTTNLRKAQSEPVIDWTKYSIMLRHALDNNIAILDTLIKNPKMKIFFLKAAYLLGKESKCVSKKVGAIIALNQRIISTGYNGTPAGFVNCCDKFPHYDADTQREEHHKFSLMYEIHGEMNAIAFAAKNDIGIEGAEIYTILQPCDDCLKNIIAAGIKKVYYVIPYDKSSTDNMLWDIIDYEVVKDKELIEWIELQENNS